VIPAIPAGRVLGVPLRIGVSWIVVIPIVGIGLFAGIPIEAGSPAARAVVAAGATMLLFASVVIHEMGHIAAARRLGVPVSGVQVFLVGGYSDVALDRVPPRTEITVAVAGPGASALLALLIGGVALVVPDVAGLHWAAGVVVLVNVAVSAANLLPGLPLDGGRVVRGMLRAAGWSARRAERAGLWLGMGVGFGLSIAGLVAAVMGRAASLVMAPAGMLLVLLAAGTRTVPGTRATDVMRPVGEPISEVEQVAGLAEGRFPVPVVRGTKVVGLVLSATPGLAGEVMTPVTPGDLIAADCDLDEVTRRITADRRPLLVVERGRLVGVVVAEDVEGS
jgi:Zn-dependent protease